MRDALNAAARAFVRWAWEESMTYTLLESSDVYDKMKELGLIVETGGEIKSFPYAVLAPGLGDEPR